MNSSAAVDQAHPRVRAESQRPRIPTRPLLICAAIGAAGGVLVTVTNIAMVALTAGLPLLFVALGGLWSAPSLLALALMRRPGVGILAGLISGVVAAPFSPSGPNMIFAQVMTGVILELPFVLTGFRRYPAALFFLGSIVLATQHSLAAFGIIGAERYGIVFQYALWLGRPASYCLVAWACLSLARRLRRAGVGILPERSRVRRGGEEARQMTGPVVRATRATETPVSVRGLRIRYPGRGNARPDGVDLEVSRGEVLLVLGPSGSGKSTLALALNGLIPNDIAAVVDGRVLIEGAEASGRSVAQICSSVGMVFQDPDSQVVTDHVFDEVCFAPENMRLPVEEIEARAEQALRAVGLWDRREDDPARLSGGGRQRLAIACALAMRAPVIVLDEPTANLDPSGAVEVYDVLRSLVSAGDTAIVLIEHALDAAIDLVDRVLVLDRGGRVAFAGPARETIIEHAAELAALGVWLPWATLAAMRLETAGVRIGALPLTAGELTSALDRVSTLPAPAPAIGFVGGPSTGAPIITVRGLDVRLGSTDALRGAELSVQRGEFLAILGPNGAGKTTLLQAVAGVAPPPEGSVAVAGIDPARATPMQLAGVVGYVFQNPEHQFVTDTVEAELRHTLRLAGTPSDGWEPRIDAVLHRLGLAEVRDAHPFLLSGGQKRRLSVGTVLVAPPPVLALDEPTFGQDRAHAAELFDMLGALHDSGTTILIVTHDLQLAAEHATHLAVVDEGRVTTHDTVDAVLSGAEFDAAGLGLPPIARATRGVTRHPEWRHVSRLAEFPAVPAPSAPADPPTEEAR